jgi:hypothetical protein
MDLGGLDGVLRVLQRGEVIGEGRVEREVAHRFGKGTPTAALLGDAGGARRRHRRRESCDGLSAPNDGEGFSAMLNTAEDLGEAATEIG